MAYHAFLRGYNVQPDLVVQKLFLVKKFVQRGHAQNNVVYRYFMTLNGSGSNLKN